MRTILTTLVLLLVLSCPLSSWATPKITVEQPQHDFGTITQGEKVPHSFVFTNAGDDLLKIERVRSSCGCTAALVSAKELQPGESGEVQAHFDSTRFRGNVTKTIYVYTNDPVQPVTQLFIKGTVREVVTIEPAQVNFGEAEAEKTAVTQVTLKNHGEVLLQLDNLQTTAQELKAVLSDKALPAGGETHVNLSLTPKPGQGRFSGYILLKIVSPVVQDLRIPVYAQIKSQ